MVNNRFGKFLKKRLSGLTFFDYLSLGLATILIIVIGLFFLRQQEWVEVEVNAAQSDVYSLSRKPPYWLANSINVGEGERDGLGRKMVEVLDVRSFERESEKKDIFLRLKVRVVKNLQKQQYVFKGKSLTIGSPIELTFSRVFLTGVVTFIEGVKDTRLWENKTVEARMVNYSSVFPETLGVQPWMAEAVRVGDKMEDSQGRVMAEVLDKKVKPAEKIITTSDGRVFLGQDPVKKDVSLVLRLATVKQDGVNYFLNDTKVKVGNIIPLYLANITILPEITRIIK